MPKRHAPTKKRPHTTRRKTTAPPAATVILGPVSLSSSSHPAPSIWNQNSTAFFAWTFPVADQNVKGIYYVLDHFGDTAPTSSAKFIPSKQKQLLKNRLAPGIWVLHVVWADKKGRLNPAVAHYQVRIGPDPGSGNIVGSVFDKTNFPVTQATVTINRGLFPSQTTDSTGKFGFSKVPAGTWSVTAASVGFKPQTMRAQVQNGGTIVLALALSPRRKKP